ncbi:hypothetical protein AZI87_13550 [Bdellovibrio bacteriovorus]|uniref:Uncharacterized protein n=1 Tax=Bdellovibrio bacteriovorus TaxID=959 RepID=A0A162G3T3_BDEBC|nr:hypothetical protein [Bdellovibrio bacteriovorus]KYG64261.1 hypothetical protein AZI87_13550 [Bdellovibrio bacteriovorus]
MYFTSANDKENTVKSTAMAAQNRIGFYFAIVQWIVSTMFCSYYLTMGIDLWAVVLAIIVCSAGQLGSAYLFFKQKNYLAVIVICVLTQICSAQVFFFPEIGKEINIFLALVVLFPLFLLEEMDHTVIFLNFAGCMVLLICSELLNYQDTTVSRQIFSFLVKFTLIIFNFGQVYFLRTYLEKKRLRALDD